MAKRPLVEIDDETQRGVFIYWNKQWTILLYSEFGEFERLGYELAKLKRPILFVWMHDSDLWGYQIEQDRKLIASFNSSPTYFGRAEETGLPTNGDPDLLCQTFGLQGQEREIRKLQKSKSFFMEQVCEQFATMINARPAASCYEYVEQSHLEPESIQFDGFEMEHLFFASDRAQQEMNGFDIHAKAVREFARDERGTGDANLPPEMRARLEHLQRQVGVMTFFFKVLFWPLKIVAWPVVQVMKLWLWFTFKRSSKQRGTTELLATNARRAFRVEGRLLINDRRRCRITLPEGVEPVPAWGLTVFAFKVNNVQVTCRAARRKEVERYLTLRSPNAATRYTVLADENFMVGTMKAKSVLLKMEDEKSSKNVSATHYMGTCIVQLPELIYDFHYGSNEPIPELDRRRIREVVSSFEMF